MILSWLDWLAYGLRVTAGWFVAGWMVFALLRQGYRNTRVLRRFHSQLQLAGLPVPRSPPGLIRTPLRHYWGLLRAVPRLADDEAARWEQRLQALHKELQKASGRHPGERKLLKDPDARALQFEFLQRFFRTRLHIELAPPGDAFAGYLPGVEGIRDFFDFCASRGYLTSREEVEKAMAEFARLVEQYRQRYQQNPPRGYWAGPTRCRPPYWRRLTRLFRPARLLAQIYWGKNHPERVSEGLPVPPWADKLITNGLPSTGELLRHRLRSVLVYETCLQALRYLAKQCASLASLSEGTGKNDPMPDLETGEGPSQQALQVAKAARLIQQAVEDLRRVARNSLLKSPPFQSAAAPTGPVCVFGVL